MAGAKYPAAPLGMITLAALLPQEWNMKLVDMNTAELHDSDIDWADLVFIGGMLPQQVNTLKLIERAKERGKTVVVGGPDPTSQPKIYHNADFLVLGEAEGTIGPFLEDLESGATKGVYLPGDKNPDITKSPVPRFDLLNFDNYLMVGVQFSRGCPFNCEFCDVIELFGRIPRNKTSLQITRELDTLYGLGYRGHVDIVDDNIIGHKTRAKGLLTTVKKWSADHKYPFYFSAEASINVADDHELLEMMESIDMRYLFVGIEAVAEDVLKSTRKMQNMNRKIHDDLDRIYRHGIIVNGGFIIGFDGETSQNARSIVGFIEQGRICMSMIGLLYALPRTQLTRRLAGENRLLQNSAEPELLGKNEIDQATSGLNFIPRRSRNEIIEDYIYVLSNVYSPKMYFDRCLKLGWSLRIKRKFKPSLRKKARSARSGFNLIMKLGFKRHSFYHFWRNIVIILFTTPSSLEEVGNLMAMYVHFHKQTDYIINLMKRNMSMTDDPYPGIKKSPAEKIPG